MKKEEILAMEAGYDLDGLVARKVAQLEQDEENPDLYIVGQRRRLCLPYSRYIATTWELVKWIIEQEPRSRFQLENNAEGWRCRWYDEADGPDSAEWASAATAEEAITKAILLGKMIEAEEE